MCSRLFSHSDCQDELCGARNARPSVRGEDSTWVGDRARRLQSARPGDQSRCSCAVWPGSFRARFRLVSTSFGLDSVDRQSLALPPTTTFVVVSSAVLAARYFALGPGPRPMSTEQFLLAAG
jgi:hypothetical protein